MDYVNLERLVFGATVLVILLVEFVWHRLLAHSLPEIMSTGLTSLVLVIGAAMFTRIVFRWMTRQQRELEALFHYSSDAILLVDNRSAITHVNPAMEALLGVPADGLIGRDVLGVLCHPGNATAVAENCPARQVLATDRPIPYLEMSVMAASGGMVPVMASFSAIPGRGGATERVAVILRDMSEKRALEAEVARLLEVAQSERREAQELYELSRSLSVLPGAERDLNDLASRVRVLFGADLALVGLLDPFTRLGRWQAGSGVNAPQTTLVLRARMGEGALGQVLSVGRPFRTDHFPGDVTDDESAYPILKAEGTRAALAVPLALGGEPFGALLVGCRQPFRWQERQVQLLESVAAQVSVALENSRLYREIERVAVLEERDRLAREMLGHARHIGHSAHFGRTAGIAARSGGLGAHPDRAIAFVLDHLDQAARSLIPIGSMMQLVAVEDPEAGIVRHKVDVVGLAGIDRQGVHHLGLGHGVPVHRNHPEVSTMQVHGVDHVADQLQHFTLPGRQLQRRIRRRAVAYIGQDLSSQGASDCDFTLVGGPDGGEQFAGRQILEQVPAGAGPDGLVDVVVVIRGRQNQHPARRDRLQDRTGSGHAVHAGHLHIHQHYVGRQVPGQFYRLMPIPSLADDVHIGLGAQKAGDSLPDQVVIICKQHTNPCQPPRPPSVAAEAERPPAYRAPVRSPRRRCPLPSLPARA